MANADFERLRALARRFDRMATEAQQAQRRAAEPAAKGYFEGKREAFATAASEIRHALSPSGVIPELLRSWAGVVERGE